MIFHQIYGEQQKYSGEKEILLRFLVYQLSAVICSIKAGELLLMKGKKLEIWQKYKNAISGEIGLSFKELHHERDSLKILFYNSELLLITLNNALAVKMCGNESYPEIDSGCCNIEEILAHLALRFETEKFPHEIGLFLGYPPEDVLSFIIFKGKGFSCCRYWKVYHNESNALSIFNSIDFSRKKASELIASKISIEQTILKLKSIRRDL